MNVTIHPNPATMRVEIYVRSDTVYLDPDGVWTFYAPGEETKPYLTLDRDIYEEIMRAALGPTPTDDMLRDTRQVRDRLLTMIESEWNSNQLESK